jgi:amino acid transporter
MAPRTDSRAPSSASADGKGIPQVASELFELGKAYAKQETIDPLKGLTRFVGAGVGGAIALGIGVLLLMLAGLRALQTETSTTFTGNWSWAPYGIVALVGMLLIGLAVARVGKRKGPGA